MDVVSFAVTAAILGCAGLALASLRPGWIVGHPRVVLGLLAALSLAAVFALVRPDPLGLRIALDPSSTPLLPQNDPGLQVYREALLDFGSDDVYVVALASDDVFTRAGLETLRGVTDRIRRLPGVRGAESLTHTTAFRYYPDLDLVEVGELIEELPSEPAALASLRAEVLADSLYPKTLVSRDGRTAAINVVFRPMSDGEFVASGLDREIRRIVAEESKPGQSFFIAGGPHVRAEGHQLMVRDLLQLIPLAVLLASVLLYVLTGNRRGVLLPLGSCLTATLWTFGAMAVVGSDLNVITMVLAPTLICVGCVYGVHVLARYEVLAANAQSSHEAALACLVYTRVPVLMAGGTTCAGFAALGLTDTLATRELGGFAVFGVAAVTLLSLTGVPALLALLPVTAGDPERSRTRLSRALGHVMDRVLAGVGGLVTRTAGRGIVVWGLIALGALAAIPSIVVDTDFLTFFHPESRVRTDFARVNELLVGAVPVYVVFEGVGEGAFRDPEALRAIERIQRRLIDVPGVSEAFSAVDLVRVANGALAGGVRAEERIPDTRQGIAEILFMIPKSKLRRFATSNHSAANLVVRTGVLGSADIRELERRIREVLDGELVPGTVSSDVTGNAVLLNRSADAIAGTQALQVGVVTAVIWVLVLFVFRSPRIGLLAMLPNVVPVLVFFGVLGLGAAPLSLPTSLIGSIALGIAVDDTVHFLVAYRRERESGREPADAAKQCIRHVGRPIVITSIVLVAGFLVLLPSGFVTLSEFGLLTAMTMGICLVTDLTLLPALLVRTRA